MFSTIQILFIWFVWFSFTLLEFLFVCLTDQKYSIFITYIHYRNQQIYWSWDTLFPLVLLKYVTISSAESWKDTEILLFFFKQRLEKSCPVANSHVKEKVNVVSNMSCPNQYVKGTLYMKKNVRDNIIFSSCNISGTAVTGHFQLYLKKTGRQHTSCNTHNTLILQFAFNLYSLLKQFGKYHKTWILTFIL